VPQSASGYSPPQGRFDASWLDAIEARLRVASRRRVVDDDMPRACVLVPLVNTAGRAGVLFTKRTETVGSHKGQVSFPGGRMDPSDTDEVACALRELSEEVGVPPHAVRVLGLFHDVVSINQLRVTPVVGFLGDLDDPRALRHNTHEIDDTFVLSIPQLVDSEHRQLQQLGPRQAPLFSAGPYPVWGLTAIILDDVLREALALPMAPLS
jgi:8-oxo-dGTP pyrophosphatase MutT (NUDIX family)